MDERIHEHARILSDWSADIGSGDNVVMSVEDGAHELAVAVAEQVGKRNANLLTTYASGEIDRAYLRAHSEEFDADPAHAKSLYENADVVLALNAGHNANTLTDVPHDTKQAYDTATQDVREARLDTDWVKTIHPTRALAQQAGMAYETYQDFVYDAIIRDWERLAAEMDRLKRRLDAGSELSIRTAAGTDVTMSIEDRLAVNSAASVRYDSHNLPSGEVFTAPTDTDGTVVFDLPLTYYGERLERVTLTFEDGRVVDYAGDNEDVLEEILTTDDGAKRPELRHRNEPRHRSVYEQHTVRREDGRHCSTWRSVERTMRVCPMADQATKAPQTCDAHVRRRACRGLRGRQRGRVRRDPHDGRRRKTTR